jgi:hypothetical protein
MHGDNGPVDCVSGIERRNSRRGVEQASRETNHAKDAFGRPAQGGEMGATHEQVNLMLHLYEMRREAKLREARDWVSRNFHPKSLEEGMKIAPPGSQENTYLRMVLGYWEMVASIVNRGLVDEELFFESTGEQWGLWQQVKALVPGWREMFGGPQFLANLEEQCRRLEAWREKKAPGQNEKLRKFYAEMTQMMQEGKARAASN